MNNRLFWWQAWATGRNLNRRIASFTSAGWCAQRTEPPTLNCVGASSAFFFVMTLQSLLLADGAEMPQFDAFVETVQA